MNDHPDQKLFKALFDHQILETIDGQFRLRLTSEIDGTTRLYIQHWSNTASWYFVRNFELAIIQNNVWRVKEEEGCL